MPDRTIAFQGVLGAYSHMACIGAHPDLEVLPCQSFEDVFSAVESGAALLAMIPVQNSQAGRVADIHRLLPQRDLFIIGEHYQPVHHQLLAIEGTSLREIRSVESHPQALAQCRQYLAKQGFTAIAASDTAGAAQDVAKRKDPTVAALASEAAARIHGLTILDRNVQDALRNTTRFLVMSRTPIVPRHDEKVITTLLYRIRNLPAALYKSLGGFATNGINLLKIESYQLGGAFEATQFLVEFEGHPNTPAVAGALTELRYFCTELHILGSYPAHVHRSLGAR